MLQNVCMQSFRYLSMNLNNLKEDFVLIIKIKVSTEKAFFILNSLGIEPNDETLRKYFTKIDENLWEYSTNKLVFVSQIN